MKTKEYTQTPLRPILVNKVCTECKAGNMKACGTTNFSVEPPTFNHKCSICGVEEVLTTRFPLMEYVVEGELINMETYKPREGI